MVWGITAQSQPVPNANKGEKQTQPTENNKQRATETPPATQAIQKAPTAESGSSEEKLSKGSEPSRFSYHWWLSWFYKFIDDPIALFTFVLAISTILLWLDTRGLRKLANRQSDDMKISLDIATTTANALQATERAYLFVEFSLNELLGTRPSGFPITINVMIWNYGKTPAEVIKIRGYPVVQETQKIAPQSLIEFEGSDRELPPGLGIATNCSYPLTIDKILTDNEIGEIERWNMKLFIVGCISYRDIFGEARETGFCWELLHHNRNQRFVPTRNSALNKRT